MRLHEYPEEFSDLISIVAESMHIPESAVERDYYIVLLLQQLEKSEYADSCVFKGGTSLSKCYPGSIERFSEDIDLTFLGMDFSDKECDRTIKRIEKAMTVGAQTEKIGNERSNRSKSMFVWFQNKENKIKLEIGSTVRPDPYSKRPLKTYIQEYLDRNGHKDDMERFQLEAVSLNVLNIERTFIDKVMSVKRHAICNSLSGKVRHIYDVVRLYDMAEIQDFLADKTELKRLLQLTKETDSYYLTKRNIPQEYDPTGPYKFEDWKDKMIDAAADRYEHLHEDLLYTDQKQDFGTAIAVFKKIDCIFNSIGE